MPVAEYSGKAGFLDKPLHKLWRKARLRPLEITPVETDRDAGDLPVPGRRILASGLFAGAAIVKGRAAVGFQSGRVAPGRQPAGCAEAEFDKIGNVQRPFAGIAIRFSRSA